MSWSPHEEVEVATNRSTDVPEMPGRYLFAVARGLDPRGLSSTTGLHGAPLDVVPLRDLQAVVCSVDLSEFGEEEVARNLEDLRWLEEVARCHHEVVVA